MAKRFREVGLMTLSEDGLTTLSEDNGLTTQKMMAG